MFSLIHHLFVCCEVVRYYSLMSDRLLIETFVNLGSIGIIKIWITDYCRSSAWSFVLNQFFVFIKNTTQYLYYMSKFKNSTARTLYLVAHTNVRRSPCVWLVEAPAPGPCWWWLMTGLISVWSPSSSYKPTLTPRLQQPQPQPYSRL